MDRRWIAPILLCFAQFIVVLDASIVNVALPSIGEALDFSQENLAWVVNAYVLTFGGFLLLGGRLADLLGRRRVFISGLLLVAAASLAAGFAANEGQLIAARAAQGLGAAIISPSALSIVANTFSDGAERNKALGAWGAISGAGGAAGVLLGGVLTDGPGWEWVLWINVPVALVVAALAPRLILESRSESATRHFDTAGAVSVTAGLSLLVYAIVDANDAGWGSTQTLGLLGSRPPCSPPSSRSSSARRRRWCPSGSSASDPDRRQHRRPARRRIAVLDVLLHHALHAAGARLQSDRGRPGIPAARAHDLQSRPVSPPSSSLASASSR